MAISEEQLIPILVGLLTPQERSGGVVYVAGRHIPSNTVSRFASTEITSPWESLLAFVDRDPMANWTHSCRYILISRETGEFKSIEAQTPPFDQGEFHWRVVYKAASVPEAVLVKPR